MADLFSQTTTGTTIPGQNNATSSNAAQTSAPVGGTGMSSPYFSPNLFGITDEESQIPVYRQLPSTHYEGSSLTTTEDKTTVGQAAQDFAGGDPSLISQYQQQLLAGHFYESSYYGSNPPPISFGQADEATRKAFAKALEEAASSNGRYSIDDVINNHVDSIQGMAQKSAKPPRLTNPDDVEANAQAVAPNVIGHRLDQATLNALTGKAETMAESQYTASDGQSAYYNSSPSQSWLEEQIRQMMPETTQAFSTFQGAQAAQQLLGSSASPIGNLYHG